MNKVKKLPAQKQKLVQELIYKLGLVPRGKKDKKILKAWGVIPYQDSEK